ncbi:MAG: response regulator [Anaerolineae bacterium]|nr:response regulator [Anaerolineae bacterium]
MAYRKVLIVEDSPIQAMALQKLLEQQGLRVVCAPNGRVGVDMAERWKPDVIVLDIKMPDMDGFEVCQQLQSNVHTSHIPVVMLTVYSEPAMLRQSIYLGAVDFIPKDDFANAVLLETLRQLRILENKPRTYEVSDLEEANVEG